MSRKIPLYFYGYIFKENTVFFVDDTFKCLFQYNWQSEEVKFIYCFDELLKNLNYPLFGVDDMTYCGNSIFMFASGQSFIICYDILDKQGKIINIPQHQGKKFNIGHIITYGDLVWIFAQDIAQGVYAFDMRKKHVERDITFSKSAQKYSGSLCEGIIIKERHLFITALHNTNIILEINFANKSISDLEVPENNLHLENVVCEGDVFYMVETDSSDVYEWNKKKKVVRSYLDTQDKRIGDKEANSYHDVICNEEGIYIVPWIGRRVLKLDRQGGCESFLIPSDELDYRPREGMGIFCGFNMINKKIWSAPYGVNAFLSYDIETGKILAKKVAIDVDSFPAYEQVVKRQMYSVAQYGVRENDQFLLYDLITLKLRINNSDSISSKCGKAIYLESFV